MPLAQPPAREPSGYGRLPEGPYAGLRPWEVQACAWKNALPAITAVCPVCFVGVALHALMPSVRPERPAITTRNAVREKDHMRFVTRA